MKPNRSFFVHRSKESKRRFNRRTGNLESAEDGKESISIYQHGGEPVEDADCGIRYEIDTVADVFTKSVPSGILDLLEVAVATFAADKFVAREVRVTGDDEIDRLETRNIRLTIPVLTPEFATERVEILIGEMVSHMTRDIIEYDFIYTAATDEPYQTRLTESPEAISLLSDGLDSTAGVFYNEQKRISSEYVTVNYGHGTAPRIQKLSDSTEVEPITHSVKFDGSAIERTQFSRGLLHFAFGAATALAYEADRLQCFENGVMAQFVVLQDGWQTTRTVSAHFLRTFNSLLQVVFDGDCEVVNPFRMSTKTEIVNWIQGTETALQAVSCPHRSRYGGFEKDNCGLCVPCIVRNVGLLASQHQVTPTELSVYDTLHANFEQEEIPGGDPTVANRASNSPDTFFNAMSEIAYFCRQIQAQPQGVLGMEYPELLSLDTYRLHQQFAKEFTSVLTGLRDQNPTVSKLLASTQGRHW